MITVGIIGGAGYTAGELIRILFSVLMLEILKSNVDSMHPNEVNAARAYICDQILSEPVPLLLGL